MTVHIALIGTTKEPVQEGILKYGNVSKIFILHSPNREEFPFENFARELVQSLTAVGFTNIELRVIDAFDMQNVVESIIGIFNENPTQKYLVNITGGTKLTAAAAAVAAFIIGAEAYYVMHTGKIDKDTNPIRQLPLPQIGPLNAIQGIQLDILRYLFENNGMCSNSNIREGLEISGKILSYHIKKLGEKKLITTRRGWTTQILRHEKKVTKTDSRAITVELTNAGRFVVTCRVSY